MNYKIFFYIVLLSLIYNCKSDKKQKLEIIKKSNKDILVKHKSFSSINKDSYEKINSWKSYENFKEFIQRFENISPNEAFANVKELKSLTETLKDSLTIYKFKTPAFKARLNVLENEVLRLDDMADIPAITSTEVNLQIDKIFLVFSSLNEKINALHDQEALEEEINLDTFFKVDSLQ